MTNFKRSTAAAALLIASAVPAFAQTVTTTGIEIPEGVTVPDEHILLQFTDMEGFYVVSFDHAAELCGIGEPEFAAIAEDPSTGVIYCEELADVALRETAIEEGRIVPLTDFEDADDDDDDGDFGDDAEETAEDEANDADGDGILDEDDDDMDDEDGLIDDDSADDPTTDEDAADDATTGDDTTGDDTTGDDTTGDDTTEEEPADDTAEDGATDTGN